MSGRRTHPFPTGEAKVAGVVGRPIAHSLSPVIHNAWIEALGLDAIYAPFSPQDEGFERFVRGLRGAGVTGLNITAPFKERALATADEADATARAAGSANLLLFDPDGGISARSTDGAGLLAAFAEQAPDCDLAGTAAVVLGAGGAARAAVAALLEAGSPRIFVLNRTAARAEELVFGMDASAVTAHALGEADRIFAEAGVLINAAAGGPAPPLNALPDTAVVMDMSYRPLMTGLLRAADARGLGIVDGLSMLINQAIPSFEAFFGQQPPTGVDVRALALQASAQVPQQAAPAEAPA